MPLGARATATPSKVRHAERAARALALRAAGRTFAQIARTPVCVECIHDPHEDACPAPHCLCDAPEAGVLYSQESAARRAVQRALRAVETIPAAELLALELARCDELQAAAWPAALAGDWEAHRQVLRTMERRARLLGLDDFERSVAAFVEAQATADDRLIDQFHGVFVAVLGRLDLPPDAQYSAPQILGEELAKLAGPDPVSTNPTQH